MASINERIIAILNNKYKGNVSEFARNTGIPQSTLNNIVGNRFSKPSSDNLEKLINCDELLNARWLLTGRGEMYAPSNDVLLEADVQYTAHTPAGEKYQGLLLCDVNKAKSLEAMLKDKEKYGIGWLQVPHLPDCDAAIYMRGDNMYPVVRSGDIVCFKTISDYSFFMPDEMYLIDLSLNGDNYLIVKYVSKENETSLRLDNYNDRNHPMVIGVDSINSISLIKAIIRLNAIR